jgi:hypothetical protein
VDALRSVLGDVMTPESVPQEAAMRSPGMMARHYSPATPFILLSGERDTMLAALKRAASDRIARGESVVVLAFDEDRGEFDDLDVTIVQLGPESDPAVIGARLYAALREADAGRADVILARSITTRHPLSVAIADRLRRAASI